MKMRVNYFYVIILFSSVVFAQTKDEPWQKLFNGKDFSGWSIIGSNGKAWIEDSEIVAHQVVNTAEHTFIKTNEKYSNFILESDVKIDGEIHTGFLLRCIDATGDTASVRLYGYQVKIDPTPRRWTGGVFDDFGKTFSWWYTLKDDERARSAFKLGKWNHFRMEAIDSTIKVWVNGIPTTNMINGKYTSGYIAIKIHWIGNTPEKENINMHYKNIKIITDDVKKYSRSMDIPAKYFK